MNKTQLLNSRSALQAVVASSTSPRAAKRAALLKLSELRRLESLAAKPAPKPLFEGRKTDDDARHFAFTKYKFLCAQRSELGRRWGRLGRDKFELHQALSKNLPDEAPPHVKPHDEPQAIFDRRWDNFVASIKTTLAAVRDLPTSAI